MQCSALDTLYSELEQQETATPKNDTSKVSQVVTALEKTESTVSLNKLTKAIFRAASHNKKKVDYSMQTLFENAVANVFMIENMDLQTHKLNRLIFPLTVRKGVQLKKGGESLSPAPASIQELFKAIDLNRPTAAIYEDERYIFIRKFLPPGYSAVCGTIKLSHIPQYIYAEGKVQVRMMRQKTHQHLSFACPALQPFDTDLCFARNYHAIEMKLLKGDQEDDVTLKNWAIGYHPDRPQHELGSQLCLLGESPAK
jgi:hypothetical protein